MVDARRRVIVKDAAAIRTPRLVDGDAARNGPVGVNRVLNSCGVGDARARADVPPRLKMIWVMVRAVTGHVRSVIREVFSQYRATAVELVSLICEVVVRNPAAVTTPMVLVAADEPLFGQVDRDIVMNEDGTFDWADGAERPAATAAALVLDGCYAVVVPPVPRCR